MLTKPNAPRSSIRPVKVSAQIASLKWSRPDYVEVLKKNMGPVDYKPSPPKILHGPRLTTLTKTTNR
jgi:hypothetical protein